MKKAIWNGAVIAEAQDTEVQIVENNVYFPSQCVNHAYLIASDKHTVCGWKGTASYYSLQVNGAVNEDAVWVYPVPKDAAKQIAGMMAFWRGVKIETE
mgnify:CR=1 FL=1